MGPLLEIQAAYRRSKLAKGSVYHRCVITPDDEHYLMAHPDPNVLRTDITIPQVFQDLVKQTGLVPLVCDTAYYGDVLYNLVKSGGGYSIHHSFKNTHGVDVPLYYNEATFSATLDSITFKV